MGYVTVWLFSSGLSIETCISLPGTCLYISIVGLWCDMLGALHWREDSLSWSGPSLSPQPSGEWTQARQTKKCCLQRGAVRDSSLKG